MLSIAVEMKFRIFWHATFLFPLIKIAQNEKYNQKSKVWAQENWLSMRVYDDDR